MPTPLVIASGNPHKVDEFRAILAPLSGRLRVVGLGDLAGERGVHEPEETGATFVDNAAIKAVAYCRQVNLACLADDSGLEVDALGGRPGVISSHYFNDGRTDGVAHDMPRHERDRRNNERLLKELGPVPFEKRTARFVCVLALAVPSTNRQGSRAFSPADPQLLHTFRGTFEGRIGFAASSAPAPGLIVPRGEHGFGYDPLFLVAPEFTRTGAQLAPDEKNRLSHRARAGVRLLDWLAEPANLALLTRGA